jgi:FkbM family methyltransferase
MKSFLRFLKKCFGLDVNYQIGEHKILLPAEHLLPVYQATNKQYDQFLPCLAKQLSPGSLVVDVGANCGDTLAALVSANLALRFICVEPDDGFFSYLNRNVGEIKKLHPQVEVEVRKCLAGRGFGGVVLEGDSGSRHAVFSDKGTIATKPLDEIVGADSDAVSFVKIDVDGFDYDVINSGARLFQKQKPILFFECQTDTTEQFEEYGITIRALNGMGYCDWTMFDNFGAVLLRTDDINHVFSVMKYVQGQNLGTSTRTIYYVDVLCAAKKDSAIIDNALAAY